MATNQDDTNKDSRSNNSGGNKSEGQGNRDSVDQGNQSNQGFDSKNYPDNAADEARSKGGENSNSGGRPKAS